MHTHTGHSAHVQKCRHKPFKEPETNQISNIDPVPANINVSEWRLNIRVILRLVHQSLIRLGSAHICGPGFLHRPVFVHVPSEGERVCCVRH